jgi:hypothetical protein
MKPAAAHTSMTFTAGVTAFFRGITAVKLGFGLEIQSFNDALLGRA